MSDAVLTLHTNPATCGVAKFNIELARRLGVDLVSFESGQECRHPLLSIKKEEWEPDAFQDHVIDRSKNWKTYDVLWHGSPDAEVNAGARRVLHASDVGAPSTIRGNVTRGAFKVLTFGMAHKLVLSHFVALKAQLEVEQPNYTILLSTAVHEGSPWDTALTDTAEVMRGIFGDRLRVLGFLSDDALARELQDCDAVAMFFTPALRKNNTSYWAAVEAGKPVYTNRDDLSPKETDAPVTWAGLLDVIRA